MPSKQKHQIMNILIRTALLSTLALLALPWKIHAADALKVEFDDQGLVAIIHNGVELMQPDDPRFRLHQVYFVDAEAKDGGRQMYRPKPKTQSFDMGKKVLVQEYEGFRVECAYTVKGNRLDMQITLTNESSTAIRDFEVFPLTLCLPHTPKNAGEWGRRAFLVDEYEHEKGTVVVTPTGYFYSREGPHGSRSLYVAGPVRESRPHHPVIDDAYWYEPGSAVPPGKTGTYRVSLVFGPPGSTAQEVCPDAYAEYAKAHPMELKWPDRRPIGTAFLCNAATGWPTNPRGWFQDAKVDVTTAEGIDAFHERLLVYADRCIEHMKELNAQGIIVWNIEGQEQPHMISYIGDPRQLPKLSPEMDRYADEFMKKFRDAGFRTGITIRPTELYETGDPKRPWGHRDVKDPVAEISAKIKYAQKRWGCTIFYLDSDVFGAFNVTEEQKKEVRNIPWVIPSSMLEKLTKLHPDCLISPEFAGQDLYRFSAPYSSPNLSDGGTDPRIRRLSPEAFRLVQVRQDLLEKRWESFVESVEKGDVLMFLPWGVFTEQTFIQLLYHEAAIRKGGALTALNKADAETLAKKAKDPAEATRYAAATALGKAGTPAATAALARLLTDDSPLVQKQALVGLAQISKIADPACLDMLEEWIKGSKDPIQNALRSLAAEALARGGDIVVPSLVEILGDEKMSGTWSYAIRALGRTGTTQASAGKVLMAFLNDPAPTKVRFRKDVIEALGLLKSKEAVPSLLPILDKQDRESEEERGAVVVALGRIGDRRAVQPLINQFKLTYSTVVVYWIQGALDEALRSITGEKTVVGKLEWLRWNEGAP